MLSSGHSESFFKILINELLRIDVWFVTSSLVMGKGATGYHYVTKFPGPSKEADTKSVQLRAETEYIAALS